MTQTKNLYTTGIILVALLMTGCLNYKRLDTALTVSPDMSARLEMRFGDIYSDLSSPLEQKDELLRLKNDFDKQVEALASHLDLNHTHSSLEERTPLRYNATVTGGVDSVIELLINEHLLNILNVALTKSDFVFVKKGESLRVEFVISSAHVEHQLIIHAPGVMTAHNGQKYSNNGASWVAKPGAPVRVAFTLSR